MFAASSQTHWCTADPSSRLWTSMSTAFALHWWHKRNLGYGWRLSLSQCVFTSCKYFPFKYTCKNLCPDCRYGFLEDKVMYFIIIIISFAIMHSYNNTLSVVYRDSDFGWQSHEFWPCFPSNYIFCAHFPPKGAYDVWCE